MEEEKESTARLDCLKALKLLCDDNPALEKEIQSDFRFRPEDSFKVFLKKQFYDAVDLQYLTNTKLLVVQETVYPDRHTHQKLLFDGRFALDRNQDSTTDADAAAAAPTDSPHPKRKKKQDCIPRNVFLVLNAKEELVLHCSDITLLKPLSHHANFRSAKYPIQSLASLMPTPVADADADDPTDYKETVKFLKRHDPTGSVSVRLCFKLGARPKNHIWIKSVVPAGSVIFVEAVPDANYKLAFRKRDEPPQPPPPDWLLDLQPQPTETAEEDTPLNAFKANRSCAVSVSSNGLNLAFRLGVICVDTLATLSHQLADAAGSLHVDNDDQGHPRCVTYSDRFGSQSFELRCDDKWIDYTERQYDALFTLLFERQEMMERHKLNSLRPVLQLLQTVCAHSAFWSPWKKALFSLQRAARQLTVVTFAPDDAVLHNIKIYFAHFVAAKKKKAKGRKNVTFHSTLQNNLVALTVPELMLLHVGAYYIDVDESDLFSGGDDTTPPPYPIAHARADFHHQPKLAAYGNSQPPWTYCIRRGKKRCEELRRLWTSLNAQLLEEFTFDLASLPFTNLSTLAFQLVWFKVALVAGPLHHALEKVKPFNDDLLRHFCKGGFSYSCRDRLECGRPIWPSDNPTSQEVAAAAAASSIFEADLNSSYGWSASQTHAPTGFGVGYVHDVHKDQPQPPPDSQSLGSGTTLTRTDLFSRHTGFEFLAVYNVIYTALVHYKWQDGKRILFCYSNYHSLGFLKIGPYPVDLAIVFTDGTLAIYQMDGIYFHGCDTCPPLASYAGGISSPRAKTLARDAFLREWIDRVNLERGGQDNFATYTVITDCHHPEFEKKHLLQRFRLLTELVDLVDPYPTSRYMTVRDLDTCDPRLAFVAIVKGQCGGNSGTSGFGNAKPLFLFSKEERQERYSETGPDQDLLLTRDMYDYLRRAHGFTVSTMTACFFYRKCTSLNGVFRELVDRRASHKAASRAMQAAFLKHVVNRACGYFGLNQRKNATRTTCTLVTGLQNAHPAMVKVQEAGCVAGTEYFTLIRHTKNQALLASNDKRAAGAAALPLFICIVEMGKLRLAQMLHFIESHVSPSRCRYLYSNVDNYLYCLAGPTLDATVDPDKRESFERQRADYFSDAPGACKLEWTVGPEEKWKFITPMMHNWSLVGESSHNDRHKMSCLVGLSALESYETSVKMFEKTTFDVRQVRRVNKLAGMDTKIINFVFNQ